MQKERLRYRRRLHARIARVGEEARRWTALVESEAAKGTVLYDHQPIYPTYALLSGANKDFLVKEKYVSAPQLLWPTRHTLFASIQTNKTNKYLNLRRHSPGAG